MHLILAVLLLLMPGLAAAFPVDMCDNDGEPVPSWAAGRDANGCLLIDPDGGGPQAPIVFGHETINSQQLSNGSFTGNDFKPTPKNACDCTGDGDPCNSEPTEEDCAGVWADSSADGYARTDDGGDTMNWGGSNHGHYKYLYWKNVTLVNTILCKGGTWDNPVTSGSCTPSEVNTGAHRDNLQLQKNAALQPGGWAVLQDSIIANSHNQNTLWEVPSTWPDTGNFAMQGSFVGNHFGPIGFATDWGGDCRAMCIDANCQGNEVAYCLDRGRFGVWHHLDVAWFVNSWTNAHGNEGFYYPNANKMIIVRGGTGGPCDATDGCDGVYDNQSQEFVAGWPPPLGTRTTQDGPFRAGFPGNGLTQCPNGLIGDKDSATTGLPDPRLSSSDTSIIGDVYCYTSIENAIADTVTASADWGDCPARTCPHALFPFAHNSISGWDTPIGGCTPACGNGQPPTAEQCSEQCDDGNSIDTDPCRNNCTLAICGDLVTCSAVSCTSGANGGPEQGDPGQSDSTSFDGPGAGLSGRCTTRACGDTYKNSTEQCDSSATGGDSACPGFCTSCACAPGCPPVYPNGQVTCGEACDDNDSDNTTDMCRSPGVLSTCGDSLVCSAPECTTGPNNGPEAGDPGGSDSTSFDGPNAGLANRCSVRSCGDGYRSTSGAEECDASAPGGDAACPGSCTSCACACTPTYPDGAVTCGEQCDDNNGNNTTDMCRSPGVLATCGDGLVCSSAGCTTGPGGGIEAGDPGGTDSAGFDGPAAGFAERCSARVCGDTYRNLTEACDASAPGGDSSCPGLCNASCTCAAPSCGNDLCAGTETVSSCFTDCASVQLDVRRYFDGALILENWQGQAIDLDIFGNALQINVLAEGNAGIGSVAFISPGTPVGDGVPRTRAETTAPFQWAGDTGVFITALTPGRHAMTARPCDLADTTDPFCDGAGVIGIERTVVFDVLSPFRGFSMAGDFAISARDLLREDYVTIGGER